MKKLIPLMLVLLIVHGLFAQKFSTKITSKDLKTHISRLASDELKGREPGTEGDRLAAEYIRDRFKDAGLQLPGDDGYQYFEIVKGIDFGSNNYLKFSDSIYQTGKGYNPLSFSASAKVEANIAFAGYGFIIDADTLKWNDYKQIDAQEKWVMMFRSDPDLDNPKSGFAAHSSDRYKVLNATDQGAAGVLLVNSTDFDKEDTLDRLNRRESAAPATIPVVQVTRELAADLLGLSREQFSALEKGLNEKWEPTSFHTNKRLEVNVNLEKQKAEAMNVLAYLPGKISDDYIIVGAHYDHLGMGGSSSRVPDTVAVHYGADDNASGVAMVIELAQKAARTKPERGMLFMAFGAEEMGLLGSGYYSDNQLLPKENAVAMLNFDMLGRLNKENYLQIGGTGTAAQFDSLLATHIDSVKYKLKLSKSGTGPSDHSSFYGADIPVLYFSTGVHDDYHTPRDHADAINYEGEEMIGKDMFAFLEELVDPNQKLDFRKVQEEGQQNMRTRMKVTLGIVPDFATDIKGLGVAGIRPGRPAANGGMEKGDVIVAIEGKPIANIYDYMFRLGKFEKGQVITVEVKRGEEKEILLITL